MSAADIFWPTIHAVGTIFAGGAALVLAIGRFNLRCIVQGELGARYLGWLLLTPLYMAAIFVGGAVGIALLMLAIAVATAEYVGAAHLSRRELALLGGTTLVTLGVALWVPALFGPLPALVLLGLTLRPILEESPEELRGRVRRISWGYLYVIWTLAHALLLWQVPQGQGLLIVLIAGCGLADIGAYCVGKAIGRRPIAPRISPNKCWEGLLGNLLGASIAVALFRFVIPALDGATIVGLVLLIGLGSAWGDLLSSLAKRSAGIKDWSNLIPGHGGLLDRLNSLIVVLPLAYYYLLLVG